MARKIIRTKGIRIDNDDVIDKTKRALIRRDVHIGIGKIPSVIYEFLNQSFDAFGKETLKLKRDTNGGIGIHGSSRGVTSPQELRFVEESMSPNDENGSLSLMREAAISSSDESPGE